MAGTRIRDFLHNTRGTATVETVLWFPMFMFIFGLMVDVAMIFHGQAKVLRIVQDSNRQYSIGNLADETATETFVETQLAAVNIVGVATTTEIAGVAHTSVIVGANQLQVIGFFTTFNNLNLNISAEHMIENWEA